ncbi:MAG: mechanosensitive ion channel, partial [Gemmatimonadetes bacterium]|nr:mechanosensitive ion channel family protein [Gemmatimonadota bacterium]NIR80915.1 mechanosensitive ion channel family protein [Gemmatimonadota bacterium]NIT89733.1 mechanosensitive ion channel family protein [Gemmatimonadota bacterium]NIU33519.1 mechanosensitive ion channel family protein [Gemmatimonadota bacterium]NIU37789.1 mechanosensitive ion channel [Gemmatimonadota bacterium]
TRATGRGLVLSVWFWAFWRIGHLWELESLARAVVALWIVALSLPLAGLVSDLLEVAERSVGRRGETPLDQTALPLLNKIVRFLIVILGVLVALESVGVDVTPLLAGAGVAGLAVSLAAKDTLSNLIAGILLILDRPFQVGDRIELWSAPGETGSWGDVVEIGLRATKIRNPDNLIVVIPNNEIMRRDIVNYTASGSHIRLRLPFGISYTSDTQLAKRLILESAREVEGVKLEPEPAVIVRRFGDSAVDLELRVWIHEARLRRAIGDEITERVKETFDAHGVEIPYPKRDIYIRSGDASPPAPAPSEPDPAEGSDG